MVTLFPLVSGLLTGAVAGAYMSVVVHDFRVESLNGAAFVAMHQMRDRTYRVVMPILGFTALACLLAAAAGARDSAQSGLFLTAAALCAADIAIAMRHQVPLNRLMQSWDPSAPPAHWPHVRDRWERGHRLRTLLGFSCFAVSLWAMAGPASMSVLPIPDSLSSGRPLPIILHDQ